jgi:phosphoenolpyruvate carboxykinase (ATP)
MPINVTRTLLTAALDGTLNDGEFHVDEHFGFQVPAAVEGVDSRILKPRETWSDKEAFDAVARKLVRMFQENFSKFESVVQPDVMPIAMSA